MTNTGKPEGETVRNLRTATVSLNVLQEACRRISGMCHRYTVEASRNRAYLTYSNPNEYGSESPMTAVLPAYEEGWPEKYTVVVLDILRVQNDTWHGEGWQAFDQVLDLAKRLHRDLEGRWQASQTFYTARLNEYPLLGACPECGYGTVAKVEVVGPHASIFCYVCHTVTPAKVRSEPKDPDETTQEALDRIAEGETISLDATVQEALARLIRLPYAPIRDGFARARHLKTEWWEGENRVELE